MGAGVVVTTTVSPLTILVTSIVCGVAGAPPQAASKLAIIETKKRVEINFLIDMVFILLGMNGVKV